VLYRTPCLWARARFSYHHSGLFYAFINRGAPRDFQLQHSANLSNLALKSVCQSISHFLSAKLSLDKTEISRRESKKNTVRKFRFVVQSQYCPYIVVPWIVYFNHVASWRQCVISCGKMFCFFMLKFSADLGIISSCKPRTLLWIYGQYWLIKMPVQVR